MSAVAGDRVLTRGPTALRLAVVLGAVFLVAGACVDKPNPWLPSEDGGMKDGVVAADASGIGGDGDLMVPAGTDQHDQARVPIEDLQPGEGATELGRVDAVAETASQDPWGVPPSVEWELEFGSKFQDRASSLVESYTGDLVACGHVETQTSDHDVWGVRLKDGTDEVVWEETYKKDGQQWCSTIQENSVGQFYGAGLHTGVFRLNADGGMSWWMPDWYEDGGSNIKALKLLDSPHLLVVGYAYPEGPSKEHHGFAAKLSVEGEVVWNRQYGTVDSNHKEALNDFVMLPSGDIVAVGWAWDEPVVVDQDWR
jgi:hypothetical protein